ncbi:glycosyltransferase family 2 protein [Halomarina oriensis]|uniref:Glycosyltransferase n=1 Tax=Halomarina oriensis TaxID=671145 RepID=A0A6B0GNY9_9EURY|nr:glycosyltransferase [Halomarina oriensis]MWG33318.1 glycosyltransferase [Halomarina oriensis]
MSSVGLVVPAFRPNAERLASYVRALDERVAPADIRLELDDPDRETRDALRGLDDLPVTVNAVPYRRGKGAAITSGFDSLDTDVLAFVDADGATPPRSVEAVLAPLLDGDAAIAVGSRRHPDATVLSHQTRARRRMGDAFAWLARRLLDVDLYDFQCGAKAISADAWANVRQHLYEPGFAWDVEFVAMSQALGYSLVEVPVTWEDQPNSTVEPLGAASEMGRALFVARHRSLRLQDHRFHGAFPETTTALVDRQRR